MSKWLFDPQEWPKVTKQPLVTRVHGVKGDEPARRIVQHYAAPLDHFLVGQTQKRVNSGLDMYGSHQELDGIKVKYSYQQGMEYLDIYVSQQVAQQFAEVTEEDFWDYALVELFIQDMHYDKNAILLTCYAHLTNPNERTITEDMTLPFPGVASITDSRDKVDPIINAATKAPPGVQLTATASSGSECCASFTVDLRQSRGDSVDVELYPYVFVNEGLPTPHFMGVSSLFSVNSDPAYPYIDSDYNTEFNDRLNPTATAYNSIINPPSLGSGDLPETYVIANNGGVVGWSQVPGPQLSHRFTDIGQFHFVPLPAIHWDDGSQTWKFDATDDYFYVQDYGHQTASFVEDLATGALISQSYDNTYQWWRYWKLIQTGTNRTYTGPSPIPATARVTLFKGVPALIGTSFIPGTNPAYARWTTPAGGVISPMVELAVNVPTFTNTQTAMHPNYTKVSHFYGIPKLGDVLLDTHRLIRGRSELIENVTFSHT